MPVDLCITNIVKYLSYRPQAVDELYHLNLPWKIPSLVESLAKPASILVSPSRKQAINKHLLVWETLFYICAGFLCALLKFRPSVLLPVQEKECFEFNFGTWFLPAVTVTVHCVAGLNPIFIKTITMEIFYINLNSTKSKCFIWNYS